jgi:hypothetical protein
MPASPFASRGSGRPIQMEWATHFSAGDPTGESGPHATAACPPLSATGPIGEGDDGFTSGGTTNTAGFSRLDVASTFSAPLSRVTIRPLAARRSPDTISISMAIRVEVARWRKRRGLPHPVASRFARNACDQQLAAKRLSTPQDADASLLHRLVRCCPRSLPIEIQVRRDEEAENAIARNVCHRGT